MYYNASKCAAECNVRVYCILKEKQLKRWWPVPEVGLAFAGSAARRRIFIAIFVIHRAAYLLRYYTDDAAGQNIQVAPSRLTTQLPLMLLCHWPPALTIFIGILHRGKIVNVNFNRIRPWTICWHEEGGAGQHHSDDLLIVVKWLDTQTRSLGILLA